MMRRMARSLRTCHRLVQSLAWVCLMTISMANQVGATPAAEKKTPSAVKAQKGSEKHPLPGHWREVASLIQARDGHTATRLWDGRVLIAGGSIGGEQGIIESTELYDPKADGERGTWVKGAPLMYPRSSHAALLLASGKVFIAGGVVPYDSGVHLDDQVEFYDPTAGPGNQAWAKGTSLLMGQVGAKAIELVDGRIFISGVRDERGEVYDPESNNGRGGSRLTTRAPDLYGGGAITRLPDGKILIAGRGRGVGGCDQPAYVFDPDTKDASSEWTIVSDGSLNLCSPTATLLQDGNVLLVGSRLAKMADVEKELPCAFLYSYAERDKDRMRAWRPIPPPKIGRVQHTATLLPNGSVLVVGGEQLNSPLIGNLGFLSSAELYTPGVQGSPGTWTKAGNLKQARYAHTATLLTNGSVLVAGGINSRNDDAEPLASAEIYEPAAAK